ncbi:hypothetical protein [Actinacidiphila oryziradicis]|uniref:BD-FAE-like domain-containing protein n=1 Tax=Actinacidiphila oryziradicis TaxID=2571141 RepID=A0A4U0RRE0_9ACTN|nr:hypothetical protein [Actinacidiphila oryziradicis]TJZ97922.1 hypothetical protein FCI23_48875 [Actinacidiphila oryziradicis]
MWSRDAEGESAGGTLAALAGLAGLTKGAASAVVGWYPVTDLTTRDSDRADTPEALLLGGAPAALPELAAQASAVAQVSAAAHPFLLVCTDWTTRRCPSHGASASISG